MYEIKHEYGYYAVYKDGAFYCSADTYGEALNDIEEAEKGGMQYGRNQAAKHLYGRIDSANASI